MAHSAPGKHYREGLSFIEVADMFPDNLHSRAMVRTDQMAEWRMLPGLWLAERPGAPEAQTAALPLP